MKKIIMEKYYKVVLLYDNNYLFIYFITTYK